MNSEIFKQTEDYVHQLLQNRLNPKNLFHNLSHTIEVVEKVEELAEKESSTDKEIFHLKLAAWFHDTGFIEKNDGHEEVSVKIAEEFLLEKNLPQEDIEAVKSLIRVTKSYRRPENLAEKIIKDADTSHLGSDDYFDYSDLLQKEVGLKKGRKITDVEWQKRNIEFFGEHEFYTDYAIKKWVPIKELNLYEVHKEHDKRKRKARKPRKLGRGVETMFRVQLQNHIELSAIADTKANILLSVNAIIISVALSSLIPKLSQANQFLMWPTFILVIFCVLTIVMSIISTRPKISNIVVTREMIKNRETNMLFFGNFHKMKQEDFEWGIDYLIDNADILYNTLGKDLYYLGLVLERKYRLLRITYTVFMVGIVVSVLAFIIGYVFYADNFWITDQQ